jgi:hypothetical protein
MLWRLKEKSEQAGRPTLSVFVIAPGDLHMRCDARCERRMIASKRTP